MKSLIHEVLIQKAVSTTSSLLKLRSNTAKLREEIIFLQSNAMAYGDDFVLYIFHSPAILSSWLSKIKSNDLG